MNDFVFQNMFRYDFSCSQSQWSWAGCTACWLPNSLSSFVTIALRGLCPRTQFDSSFEVFNGADGYVSYRGMTRTLVSYQPKERKWIMRLVNDPTVWAVTNVSMASLIMGET